MLVDKLVLGLVVLSLFLSFTFCRFKFDLKKILFYNLIIYPALFILTFLLSPIIYDQNFNMALAIDFFYSLIFIGTITALTFGLIFIIKRF